MTADRQEGRQKVRALIEEAGVGMLTTLDSDGQFASRPMLALLLDEDPDVYFLTHSSSAKISQLAAQPRVAVTFIRAGNAYLSIAGRASALQDAALVARLWNPTYRAWFPGGVDDADLTVVRVDVDRADYWETPTSRVVRLIEAVTAVVTGTPYENPRVTVEGKQL